LLVQVVFPFNASAEMVDIVRHDGDAPIDGHYSTLHDQQRCRLTQELGHGNTSKKVSQFANR
jgi:hypothetical protein